jgi:hypothetical protein
VERAPHSDGGDPRHPWLVSSVSGRVQRARRPRCQCAPFRTRSQLFEAGRSVVLPDGMAHVRTYPRSWRAIPPGLALHPETLEARLRTLKVDRRRRSSEAGFELSDLLKAKAAPTGARAFAHCSDERGERTRLLQDERAPALSAISRDPREPKTSVRARYERRDAPRESQLF